MRFKGTVALLIVLIAVAAYVYFNEFHGKEERQKQEESKNKVIHVDPKDVTGISLIYPDRTITGVKRGEKQWEITSPPGIEADSVAWEILTTGIAGLNDDGVVDANAQDLRAYGLDNPPVKVAINLKDGRSVGFSFGVENPKKIGQYAKLDGSNAVFLVGLPWAHTFTKSLFDMRDKKLLQFEQDNVDAVKIADKDKDIELHKVGDNWKLEKPINTKAENTEVQSLITSIQFARALAIAEPTIDAKAAGLDPPSATITLHDRKVNMDRVLLFGKTAGPDKYYASDGSRNLIFVIDKQIPQKAAVPVVNWREKSTVKAESQPSPQLPASPQPQPPPPVTQRPSR